MAPRCHNRVGDERAGDRNGDGSFAVSNRTGEPSITGRYAFGLPKEPVVLCRGTKTWRASSDGPALR